MKKLLIVGAGDAGKMVAKEVTAHRETAKKYELIGFLDDNPLKKSAENKPVLGTIDDIRKIIEKHSIQKVIIAIPSASKEQINRIFSLLSGISVETKIVPGIYEIIAGNVSLSQIRPIEPSDLLGREEVGFDEEELTAFYQDKRVFVSGAGGSIGSELFIQLLNLPIKQAAAFGHGENSIHILIQKIGNDPRFAYAIGDIRDSDKLSHEMRRFSPDFVFHAAAHKHVPLMEDYPDEAVKNNILGTYYCAAAAINAKAKKFMMISTDKAVNPTSVMGATKRVAEKIVLSLGKIQEGTAFSLTRFGNVLGSRGSVIPIFKSQIEKGGPITVTHPDIERYFMSIREAARLVIKSASIEEGEVFVLDMGKPMKILELAKSMIRLYGYREDEIPFVFTGLRAGEKMYEEVLSNQENLAKSAFEKLFISRETQDLFSKEELDRLISEFTAVSKNNNIKEIKTLIKNYVPEYRGE
jgi:FlaA1/EpsC-like NDP-sugar epimerase